MRKATIWAGFGIILGAAAALGHGDTAPQSVDTTGLPDLPEEMATENPWREAAPEVLFKAVEVGAKGFNSNCARCHGLGAVSGGLAPDLRYLEATAFGDEWYLDRILHGYEQNGAVKMPPFEGILNQEAIWAIRTYVETRADEVEIADQKDSLTALRDKLTAVAGDQAAAAALAPELVAAGEGFEALSGAPRAVTPFDEAAWQLTTTPPHVKAAIETLSAAVRN
ncbi:cytochrome c-550 PedF [uncultured Paracoccus sp.]|uniref:cytochrome c-550 PedF n=1 Tax=uncultured Paracoccus sp. TaxID=189685 RepID=UPI0025CD3B1B|nr:cytochrome c-550 PedF [uncultured Paracoccus sp.]